MPKRLNITIRQRDQVFKLYARGASPTEIVGALPELKLTAKQVRTMALKGGWAQRKTEIAEIKKQSAAQVLAEVREQQTDKFRTFLVVNGESLEEDSERLKAGWGLVANAADASSLMRAKKLHFERAIEHYLGASELRAPGFSSAIASVYVQAIPIQRVVLESAEHAAEGENQDRDESDDVSLPRLAES